MVRKISFGIGLLGALGLGACRSYQGPISDHFDGDQFYNPWQPFQTSLIDVAKWKLGNTATAWPEQVENNTNPLIEERYQKGDVSISFINHASFLIQVGGLNLLSDPVFSERVSPVSFAGPKRVRAPGIALESLPKIDAILVSHNHYDHLDLESLQKISALYHPRVFVPLGDKAWLSKEEVERVDELDWWQSVELSPTVKIHFAPAQHWSSRSFYDRNKSLWGSFLIEYKGKTIYIAGDTGYGPHFKAIAERFPNVEVALLPIGAYEPRWFMNYQHMGPDGALMAMHDLKAKKAIGMHFGCFQLTDEGIDEPAKELKRQMQSSDVSKLEIELDKRFLVPEVGATYRYEF